MPDGRLDLCKQSLGVMGCHLVTEALVNNCAIASLLLGTNGIGDLGAEDVARLIQRNNCLEIVYQGKINLINALEINHHLCHLALDGQLDRRVKMLLERNRMLNRNDELQKPRSVALIQSVYR